MAQSLAARELAARAPMTLRIESAGTGSIHFKAEPFDHGPSLGELRIILASVSMRCQRFATACGGAICLHFDIRRRSNSSNRCCVPSGHGRFPWRHCASALPVMPRSRAMFAHENSPSLHVLSGFGGEASN